MGNLETGVLRRGIGALVALEERLAKRVLVFQVLNLSLLLPQCCVHFSSTGYTTHFDLLQINNCYKQIIIYLWGFEVFGVFEVFEVFKVFGVFGGF